MRRMTERVARDPSSWGALKDEVRRTFEELATEWDERMPPTLLTSFAAGLRTVPHPSRVLDLATGTGLGADLVAAAFPEAIVVGADLTEAMVRAGLRRPRPHPIRFVVGDASRLPFADRSFDLVTMINGPVFAEELDRMLRPGGAILISYSSGPETPIYLPFDELDRLLVAAGLGPIRHGRAGPGEWTAARSG